jgi:hypothetical protein
MASPSMMSDILGGVAPGTVAAKFDQTLVSLSDPKPDGEGTSIAVLREEPVNTIVNWIFNQKLLKCGSVRNTPSLLLFFSR